MATATPVITPVATPVTESTIYAYYSGSSTFEVDFDINAVHDWWIKRDMLYVIHNEGDEPEEYEPLYSAYDMLKRPDSVEVE